MLDTMKKLRAVAGLLSRDWFQGTSFSKKGDVRRKTLALDPHL